MTTILASAQPWRWSLKLAVGIVSISFLVGCSQSQPLHPSYDELVQEGFYIYVLPEAKVIQQGWREDVTIWSFNRHCQGLTAGETVNPLRTNYVDPTSVPVREDLPQQASFSVQLGPWAPVWLYGEGTWAKIDLQSEYVEEGTAEYRERYPSGVYVVFQDSVGLWVYVDSQLPLTETLSLVNSLEYVGPPPDTVGNPWDCSE